MMSLFLGLLFSSIGGVFLIVARRTYNTSYLVSGALLLIVSYLIDNALILTVIGVGLCFVPYIVARGWI